MKTPCSKSWTDVNIDFKNRLLRHCCKSEPYNFPDTIDIDFFDNSSRIQERRQQTLNGVQHPDCNHCWNDYNNGMGTYRDWMNKWTDNDFLKKEYNKSSVEYIEIELESTCDMSCLYCSSVCSSKIAQEEGITYINNTKKEDIDAFKRWFQHIIPNIKDAVIINFLGGEPTASMLLYDIVEFVESVILAYPNLEIYIGICTNCNSKPFLMNKLIKIIDKSNAKWSISISNESYGNISELIRYGLSWERFSDNFKSYVEHKNVCNITLSPTVNAFNLPTFANYINWVHDILKNKQKNFCWVGNYVSWPKDLDIKHLPNVYKKYIINAQHALELEKNNLHLIDFEKFNNFLIQMHDRIGTEYNEHYMVNIQKFIDRKNQVKNTDKLNLLINHIRHK